MSSLLLLHGPNLNLLGDREPDHYGSTTLAEINATCAAMAQAQQVPFDVLQSNSEAALIERIHQGATDGTGFIVINPAAFSHTSIALRDALQGVKLPFIEVHLSNIYQREAFRRHSYFSDIALGTICGLGAQGYYLAVQAALSLLQPRT